MKNKLYLSLAMGALLAGCSDNEIVDSSWLDKVNPDSRIAFVQKVGNMTRATQLAQNAGHYEFGVYGITGTIADQGATNTVMKNYLVAYGKNSLYNTIYTDNASTAGENASGNLTDVANGLSTWFYEGIGKTAHDEDGYHFNHTTYTTPDNDQILKYWTKDVAHHFFAYMPYAAAANAVYTADQLQLKNLHSFYTDPVTQGTAKQQPTNAVVDPADHLTDYNNEMLNYNEALYAYKEGTYNTDVPLEFQHINSKIQIAFWEDIKGYSVEIINVRPENAVTATPEEYAGIAFSTATPAQANLPMTITQPALANLPQYDREATATVSSMSTTPAVAMSDQSKDKANLRFQIPTGNIGSTNPTASLSPTVYYAMPQTPATDGTGTGLTLHISYKLHPADGATDITVYDARCYVAPEYLNWQPGKAYKYIFKITDKSNGVTNPNEPDPAKPDEPWVDPYDPRVPDDPALKPIVFDGVTITDYTDTPTGKVDDTDEWILSNTSVVNAIDWLKSATGGNYTFKSSPVDYSNYNVTLQCNAANIAAPHLYIWNDLSRILGALHEYKTPNVWVEHITFAGVQYDWQTTAPTFTGSNWSKTGEPYTGSNEDVRLLRQATAALKTPAAVIKQEPVDATHVKVTSRISMNLQFKNGSVVPFTVTVVIPDYPNP